MLVKILKKKLNFYFFIFLDIITQLRCFKEDANLKLE